MYQKYKEFKSFMILRMIKIIWLRRSLKVKQSVVKDVNKSNRIKISINWIIFENVIIKMLKIMSALIFEPQIF